LCHILVMKMDEIAGQNKQQFFLHLRYNVINHGGHSRKLILALMTGNFMAFPARYGSVSADHERLVCEITLNFAALKMASVVCTLCAKERATNLCWISVAAPAGFALIRLRKNHSTISCPVRRC